MASPSTTVPAHDLAPEDLASVSHQTTVYVYEAPVRIWHWVNAAAIMVLCVSGYFIGSPPPSMQIGEAVQQFVFGYIRFAHFAAAQILTGVERDRRRITVGPDGRAIDLISRLPAGFYQRVLVTGSRLDRRFRSGRGA